MLRNTFLFTLLVCLGFNLQAQEWTTDIESAKKQALAHKSHIIMVFQGSDWCAPCIKLDKEIWSTEEFKNYAKDHFVMLQVDFPRKKKNLLSETQQKHNAVLADTYNPNGIFPFVVIIDCDGNVAGETGYKKLSPSEYILHINSLIH